MSHIQFTRDSRVELAILLNARKNQTECAKILGMYRISICDEINNNKDSDRNWGFGRNLPFAPFFLAKFWADTLFGV